MKRPTEEKQPPETDAMSVILAALAPLAGKQILDIGCGSGNLVRSLSAQGANVVGIDPNGKALAVARQAAPTGTFHQASAEALPFADDSFDGAIFLNSLHHVPKPAMLQALQESARITKSAGAIVVVEPLAEGSFFSALHRVEDETDVRNAAQDILRQALESEVFEQVRRIDYLRREYFTDLDQFLAHVVAVDPARAAVVEERRPEVEAAFKHHAQTGTDGRTILEQPMRAYVLKVSG